MTLSNTTAEHELEAERIRVMLAVEDPATADWLRRTLKEHALVDIVGEVQDGLEAVQMAREVRPMACIIQAELPVMHGYETCELISLVAPEVATIVVQTSPALGAEQLAMRLGARACLRALHDGPALLEVLTGIAGIAARRNSREFLQATDPALMPVVIATSAAKGGVGKSSIAVNLAVTMAQRFPDETVLVDYYSHFGDAAVMLGLAARRDISHLACEGVDIDADCLQDYLLSHRCGLKLLPGGTEPVGSDDPLLSVAFAGRLLSVLRRQFRVIIVDLPPVLNPAHLHVISRANHFLLVCSFMELTTLRDSMLLINRIKGEFIGRERLKLIGNRVMPKNRYMARDLEQATGYRVAHQIPDGGGLAMAAINSGVPFVLRDPTAKMSVAIVELANLLDPRPEVNAKVKAQPEKAPRVVGKLLSIRETGAIHGGGG